MPRRAPLKRLSVLLADDHAIVAEGLRRVLEPEFEVVHIVGDGQALAAAAAELQPDVIVADVSMPVLSGIEAVRRIRQTDRHAAIVFLTMHSDVIYASEAFAAGASAYVLKTSAGTEIVAAIREALDGGVHVTPSLDGQLRHAQLDDDCSPGEVFCAISPRQRQVLQMLAVGRSTKQIAEVLGISPRTVEFHRYRAMESLGLHTIAELVRFAIKTHLIPL